MIDVTLARLQNDAEQAARKVAADRRPPDAGLIWVIREAVARAWRGGRREQLQELCGAGGLLSLPAGGAGETIYDSVRERAVMVVQQLPGAILAADAGDHGAQMLKVIEEALRQEFRAGCEEGLARREAADAVIRRFGPPPAG